MKTFNVIKKSRKYFAATTETGSKCKILIDKNSESLELGACTLAVDDISVRSKYGTDLIFKLKASAEEQAESGICSLRTEFYNSTLAARCRDLDGKWDPDQKAWIFNGILADEVEALDALYNSELIAVELKATKEIYERAAAVEFLGFTLARARGRDSGARLGDGVALISGKIGSGGSVKNWSTEIFPDTVLRLQIPAAVLATDDGESGFEITTCPH